MLAMHYRIPLDPQAEASQADAVTALRRRAAERGPLFDGMPGLALKLFLVDPVRPTYATFYLWREAAAALRFLEGDFFANLSAAFGRPAVRLLLPRRIELPRQPIASLALTETSANPMGSHEPAGSQIATLDPLDGTALAVHFDPAAGGRRFEIMYVAEGAVPLPDWPRTV